MKAESEDTMDELITAIETAMIGTGRMSRGNKLRAFEIVQDGDWARVGCYLYRTARTKKPHMYWNFSVYLPEYRINWETTTCYNIK